MKLYLYLFNLVASLAFCQAAVSSPRATYPISSTATTPTSGIVAPPASSPNSPSASSPNSLTSPTTSPVTSKSTATATGPAFGTGSTATPSGAFSTTTASPDQCPNESTCDGPVNACPGGGICAFGYWFDENDKGDIGNVCVNNQPCAGLPCCSGGCSNGTVCLTDTCCDCSPCVKPIKPVTDKATAQS